MTLSAEQLNRAKQDIADVVAAVKIGDDSNVSQESRSLLEALTALDDAAWDPLLASLEDSELRDQLDFLRRRIAVVKEYLPDVFSRIRQVGHTASFDISQRSLTIRLRFGTVEDQSLLDSSQDLEDTLWIGKAVMAVVLEVMQAMEGTLDPEAQRGCIGAHFEDNLKSAEEALAEIRRIFTTVRGADTPDDVD